MKVHQQFARAIWDLHLNYHHSPSSTLSDHKRLRPLAPKLSPDTPKSFIRPNTGPPKDAYPEVETTSHHPGGTRWNPTQEQIGILEMLYRGGMRTPNAQQIEQVTAQLSKYGKIEGKNVFYWFQNHKARERQKHKRTIPALSPTMTSSFISFPTAVNTSITLNFDTNSKSKVYGLGKRKWTFDCLPEESHITTYNHGNPKSSNSNLNGESEEEDEDKEMGIKRTLQLFPLHPEGMMGAVSTYDY